jgi:hypothetical protein
MRQFLITITLLIAVIFSVFATAAEAPDFSTWILNVAKSTLPKDITIKSRAIVIENKKLAIVFHYNRRQEVDGNLHAGWKETRFGEHVVRSTEFERELARLSACHRVHAGYKNP